MTDRENKQRKDRTDRTGEHSTRGATERRGPVPELDPGRMTHLAQVMAYSYILHYV